MTYKQKVYELAKQMNCTIDDNSDSFMRNFIIDAPNGYCFEPSLTCLSFGGMWIGEMREYWKWVYRDFKYNLPLESIGKE